MSSQSSGSTGQNHTTSFEVDDTVFPQKNTPFCLKMSIFSKVLVTREKRAISPRKREFFITRNVTCLQQYRIGLRSNVMVDR